MILVSFPKCMSSSISDFTIEAVRHLDLLAVGSRSTYLNDDLGGDPSVNVDDGDPDADGHSITRVVSHLFHYIASASRKSAGKGVLLDKLSTRPTQLFERIVYRAFYYSQITIDDEERWTGEANAFVSDEDEEIPAATTRTAALDLVSILYNTFGLPMIHALPSAMEQMVAEASRLQVEGASDWWKGYEACLVHIAGIAEELGDEIENSKIQDREPSFDLGMVFQILVLPFFSRSGESNAAYCS